jgi:S1-C subfamily serine protease
MRLFIAVLCILAFQPVNASVLDKTLLSTVTVNESGSPAGGGFIVRPGYVVTCAHVAVLNDLSVTLSNGHTPKIKLIKLYPALDLAVIRVDTEGLPSIKINHGKLYVAQVVYVIGSPFALDQSVTKGIVSSTKLRDITVDGQRCTGLIQVANCVYPGDSGGPGVTESGEVIGVAEISNLIVGFVIPIDRVMRLFK